MIVSRVLHQTTEIDDQGGHLLAQLRVVDDVLDLLKAVRVIEKKDARQKIAGSGSSIVRRGKSKRLEISGREITADALLEFGG